MRASIFALLASAILYAPVAAASDRTIVGVGRLFTNDYFGDNDDRWHTGSLVFSLLRAPEGTTTLPTAFGELIEYRFGSAILAPSNLTNPAASDRRYAGVLSVGMHTHFARGSAEYSLGVDLVAVGPQTGIGQFQTAVHDMLGIVPPSPAALANQIPNAFHPTALFELGRPLHLASGVTLRPFVEAQAGVETFVRAGGDLMWGPAYDGGIFVRDVTTGHLYQSASGDGGPGLSFVLGADIAHVTGSAYLPASGGYQLTAARQRARAGLYWQGKKAALFYGVTWLGPEFLAQPESQLVGSLRLKLEF